MVPKAGKGLTEKCAGVVILIKNMNKPINKKCSVCPLSVLDSCDERLDKTTREMFIKRVIAIIKRVHNISEVMAV